MQFLQDTNEFQKAEEILNRVVQIEPENPLGHFSLGCVNSCRVVNVYQGLWDVLHVCDEHVYLCGVSVCEVCLYPSWIP